jgi:hypothetical protein
MLASVAVSAVFAVLALGVLFFFDPSRYAIYPTCPFHQLTGLNCPGCGALRAVHQLIHGHLAAAFRLNPFIWIVLPVLLLAMAKNAIQQLRGAAPEPKMASSFWIWLLLAALILFTVLRNLPFAPFTWLAP